MAKRKVVLETVGTTIDHETGEITKISSTTTFLAEKEPEYVKVYVSDIIRLKDLTNSSEKVLNCFLRNMSWSNTIGVYMPIKKLICNELNMNLNTLNKAIDDLFKAGILLRIDRGLYLIDPNLFGKGKWEDIKGLRMIIEYTEDGRKIISGEKITQLTLFS